MENTNKKPLTQKQRNVRIIIIAIVAALVLTAAGILGATAYSKYLNSGSSDRNTVSFKSDHYKVNNCMLTYYYYSDFYNVYQSYGSYFSAMGFDPTTSMKSQTYSNSNTWFDYFINTTASNVQSYLYYAEAGKEAGYTYDELSSKIDESINTMSEAAEDEGLTLEEYINNLFGPSVKEKDIRDALELQLYSSSYYQKIYDEYKGALTDEDYDSYYENNSKSLQKIDYRSYAISAQVADDADEAEKEAAYTAARAKADELKEAAKDKNSFVAWVTNDLTEKNSSLETPLTEEEIKEKAESKTTEAAYSENDEFSEWAFDASRSVGSTTVIDNGSGTYTVYMLDSLPYRIEATTKTVRHILIKPDTYGSDDAAKAKAEEIVNQWMSGEKTEASFEALADEYNEDSKSLYENIPEGQMAAEFENWCYDTARTPQDIGIVKTSYGYHIMYFVGEGIAQWKLDAQDGILQSKFTELTDGYQEKYDIDVRSTNIYKLPDTIPATALNTEPQDITVDTGAVDTNAADTNENTADTSAADTGSDTADTSAK